MTLELATQGQSVQRSPPPPSMYKKNLHCRRHFFKENSQEKRAVPFFSLSISLKRLPKTTPYTLGLSVMREADILFPGWMLVSCRISQPAPQGMCEVEALDPRGCSLQKHNKATDPQQKWKWAILEFIGVNMWVFLWIKRIPWNIVSVSDPEKFLLKWVAWTGAQGHSSDIPLEDRNWRSWVSHPRVALHTSNNGMMSMG